MKKKNALLLLIIVAGTVTTSGQERAVKETRTKFDQHEPYVDLRNYVVGDGVADDTVGLQAAIYAAPDYSEIVCPNLKIRITSTIKIYSRRSLRLTATGANGPDPHTGCSVNWSGANGGTMVDIQRSRDMIIDGIILTARDPHTSDANSGADIGINIGQSIAGSGISTNILFQNVTFQNNSHRTSWQGAHIGDATGNNGEFMKFKRCTFFGGLSDNASTAQGKGTGVYIGHNNVKSIVLEDSAISAVNPFIFDNGGSFVALRTTGGGSRTIYRFHGSTEPIRIEDDNFEAIYQVVASDAGFGPSIISMTGGRYGAPTSGAGSISSPFFDFDGASSVYLSDIMVDSNSMARIIGSTSATKIVLGPGIDFRNTVSRVDGGLLSAGHVIDISEGTAWGPQVGSRPGSGAGSGYHFLQSTGNTARGLWMNEDFDSIYPAYGLPPCAKDSICIGDGEIEILGRRSPATPTATVVGARGSAQYIISVVAADASGKRTLRSRAVVVRDAAANLDPSNYIHLSGYAIPGAASYDIIQTMPGDSGKFRLIGVAKGATFDLKKDADTLFGYKLPTHNETSTLKFRAPLSISSTDLIQNLNADMVDGRHASDLSHLVSVPAGSTSTCKKGDFALSSNFSYFCVATDTWRRAALSSW